LLIIWTAISTPVADLVKVNGDNHQICTTGGATGTPGGLVFFFILFGYLVCILFLHYPNHQDDQPIRFN
jgi:hypothetical protein